MEGERYSGIGLKRMKGYICNLPIDELINLRNEFWKYHKAYEGVDFICKILDSLVLWMKLDVYMPLKELN